MLLTVTVCQGFGIVPLKKLFKLYSDFSPAVDQPTAIQSLIDGLGDPDSSLHILHHMSRGEQCDQCNGDTIKHVMMRSKMF